MARARDSLALALAEAPHGINSANRAHLELLHREIAGAFDAERAAATLSMDVGRTRKLLAYLARRGWLSRVRRGLYVAVPLDARRSGEWIEDSWVAAERTFSPCYIGGWSACQHWGFTEQVFRTVIVVTSRKVRDHAPTMQGIRYRVTVRPSEKVFGTRTVWRGQVRVQVSDPSRTIVDLLDDPSLGGGMRNVADVVHEYLTGEHRDDNVLVDYANRLGNRAVFKRLGYVVEHLLIDAPGLIAECLAHRSSGLVVLDPAVKEKGRIVRRWGLRANVVLGTAGGDW